MRTIKRKRGPPSSPKPRTYRSDHCTRSCNPWKRRASSKQPERAPHERPPPTKCCSGQPGLSMRRNKRRNLLSQVGGRLSKLFRLLHIVVRKLAEERRLEVSQLSHGATLREPLGKFQI